MSETTNGHKFNPFRGLNLWHVVLALAMIVGYWSNESSFRTKVELTEKTLKEDI